MSGKELQSSFAKAVKKSFSAKYIEYCIKLISMMIYARIFLPEEFGVIAVLQVFIVFFMMLSEVGIGPAIINILKLEDEDRNGLFTITCILGFIFSIIFYVFLFGLNDFYERTDYHTFGLLICIALFFNAISAVPLNLLYKENKYYNVMISSICSEILALAFILLLYFKFDIAPIWLLASIAMLVSISKFIFLMVMNHVYLNSYPCIGKNLKAIKLVFSFSVYQFSFNVLNYFSRNLDNILVGKYIGMDQLGIYGKSYELMRYPLQLLTFAFSPAIQPTIASHFDQPKEVEKLHNKFALTLLIGGGYFGAIFNTISNDIVLIILGNNWGGVANVLAIFSFIVPIQVLLSSSGGFFQGMRKTKEMFKSGVFSSSTNVTSILIGIYYGSIEILATCLVISFTINALQCYYLLYRNVFLMGYSRFLIVLFYGVLPFLLFLLFMNIFSVNLSQNESLYLRFFIGSGIVSSVYLFCLALCLPFKGFVLRHLNA